MSKTLTPVLAACLSLFLLASPVLAQPLAPMPAPTDAAVYKAFGEKPGLVKLMDDFMVRLLADPRTAPHFKDAKQPRLKEQLVDQFCVVTGGPCVYRGADMKSSHANLDIKKSDFNALVEVLQQSMNAQGIPFQAQNQLLAKLAPMYRDVITVNERVSVTAQRLQCAEPDAHPGAAPCTIFHSPQQTPSPTWCSTALRP